MKAGVRVILQKQLGLMVLKMTGKQKRQRKSKINGLAFNSIETFGKCEKDSFYGLEG